MSDQQQQSEQQQQQQPEQQRQKQRRKYGEWSPRREEALIQAMLKHHPYATKTFAGEAYRNVTNAVNTTDPQLNPLSVSSIRRRVPKIINDCLNKKLQDEFYYGTPGKPSTSMKEPKILELMHDMEDHGSKATKENRQKSHKRKDSVASSAVSSMSGISEQIREYYPAESSTQNEADGGNGIQREESRKRVRCISSNGVEDVLRLLLEEKKEKAAIFDKFLNGFREIVSETSANSKAIVDTNERIADISKRNAALTEEFLHRQIAIAQQIEMRLRNLNTFLARQVNQALITFPQSPYRPTPPPSPSPPSPPPSSSSSPPPPPPPPSSSSPPFPSN